MNVNEEEETEIIMGEIYPKIKKGKKIEVTPKKPLLDFREYADRFLIRPKYSDIDEVCRITQAQYKTGGLVRQPVLDGGGRSIFEWVFAGNARLQQDGRVWSDTCDPVAKPDWSLGSNTLEIEAKLRVHKQQERYTEVPP
jgi:hypothetical protein